MNSTVTYKYRVKGGKSCRRLSKLSSSINYVWNYCNATSFKAIRDNNKWMSGYDLGALTAGTSKELGINSQTIQAVCQEFAKKRIQAKKRKLKWRASKGSKRALGWIPFNGQTIKVNENITKYNGHEYKFWKSRELPSHPKCGSFSQDARGHWYVNFVVEVASEATAHSVDAVGIDPGLKDTATLSDGYRVANSRSFSKLEAKLAKAQRNNKKRLVKTLHAKIRNIRQDFLHKETTKIAKKYKNIYVGDVSGKFLQKTSGKSSTDAAVGMFRTFLEYKAIRHQGNVKVVSESFSTVTCSSCFARSGPSGLSDLEVREWSCNTCGEVHDRDINAAKNILRFGYESLRAVKAA